MNPEVNEVKMQKREARRHDRLRTDEKGGTLAG